MRPPWEDMDDSAASESAGPLLTPSPAAPGGRARGPRLWRASEGGKGSVKVPGASWFPSTLPGPLRQECWEEESSGVGLQHHNPG